MLFNGSKEVLLHTNLYAMANYDELLKDGISHGMCEKFQKEWGKPGVKELCEKYFRGQDFCIEHNWPDLKWLEENMRGKTIEYGILINQTVQMSQGERREFALIGNSDLTLDVFDVCDITIRHNSKIHLNVHDGCFVYVSMHDDSVLDVVSKEGTGRVCVSHFGGSVINGGLIDKFNEKL